MMMSWFNNSQNDNDEIMQDAVAKRGVIDKHERAIKRDQPLTNTRYAGRETKFKTSFLFADEFWTVEGENRSSSCFSAMYKGYIY